MSCTKHLAARWVVFVCASFAVVQMVVRSQRTTGGILGTFTDTTGAGDYVVNLPRPGINSVTATDVGFQRFVVASAPLAPSDHSRINTHRAIGNASQTVTEGITSALQTDNSVLSIDIGQQTPQDVPENSPNFTQLIRLRPGIDESSFTGGLIGGAERDDHRLSASFQPSLSRWARQKLSANNRECRSLLFDHSIVQIQPIASIVSGRVA